MNEKYTGTRISDDYTLLRIDLKRIEGLFVGSLFTEDLYVFNQGVDAGLAFRSYEGVAETVMGLARVRLR